MYNCLVPKMKEHVKLCVPRMSKEEMQANYVAQREILKDQIQKN